MGEMCRADKWCNGTRVGVFRVSCSGSRVQTEFSAHGKRNTSSGQRREQMPDLILHLFRSAHGLRDLGQADGTSKPVQRRSGCGGAFCGRSWAGRTRKVC